MKKCPQCGKEFQTAHTLCPFDGAVLQKADDGLIGTTLADKYRIEQLINEGGMGAVYRATHVLMDKTVAVKVLHPSLAADDKIVARFSREARAASRISHPHALSVTDFGESEDGIVFLVMEFLRGKTVKELIQAEGRLSLARTAEIIRQVSSALDAAHAQGVVHRDLKSDNIMLVDLDDNSDWAKVLDFGIAKIQEPVGQDPELTAPNLIIGTPQYMSPEQCSQSSEIDSRADVYSLGVILYEMLAGHVPFSGDSPTAIMMKHLQDPPPSILAERSDIPETVDEIIKKAMAKVPEDRFQSAGELSSALSATVNAQAPVVSAVTNATEHRTTDRIVVPTNPESEESPVGPSDLDETTVVRQRESFERRSPMPPPVVAAPPVPATGFNPWKIIVPSLIALVAVFAIVYALRGSSDTQATTNDNTAPISVDPNSVPVQKAPPPTGAAEQGIASGVPTSSPTNPSVPALDLPVGPVQVEGSTPPGGASPETKNQNGTANANRANRNVNASGEADTSEENTKDTDEDQPANRNSNRPASDEPPPPQGGDTPPVRMPSPIGSPKQRQPIPKPTQVPAGPAGSNTGGEPPA